MFSSCFFIDIDIISALLKILLNDLHHLSAPGFRKHIKVLRFQNVEIYKTNNFHKCSRNFLILLGGLVSPKINNIGVGARGHVQKSLNHRNDEFRVLK